MKLKKIFYDFSYPKIKDNKIFIVKTNGMYTYNVEKDVCEFCYTYKFERAWYAIYKDFLICQEEQAVWDSKSEGNYIKIFRFSDEKPFIEYEYNILFNESYLGEDFFLNAYKKNRQKTYVRFNPFTREKKWEVSFDIDNNVRISECNDEFFVLLANKFHFLCHSSQTGTQLWSFDTTPYVLQDNPIQKNGEPLFKPKIAQVKYNPVHHHLLVHLYPNQLLAIDATTGQLVWAKDIPVTIQWHLDEVTGNVYLMENASFLETYYLNGVANQAYYDTCIYHHIAGDTGETLLRQDLKEVIAPKHENGNARALGFHHFAGYKDDSLYLSLFGEGELYKLHKLTGALEESYIHDRNFESQPIIYKNRLFLTDPQGGEENETRLLVFEI